MSLFRRLLPAGEPDPAPLLCVDGQPATELSRTGDFVTVQADDGTTPTVLATRTKPCTCGGEGCK